MVQTRPSLTLENNHAFAFFFFLPSNITDTFCYTGHALPNPEGPKQVTPSILTFTQGPSCHIPATLKMLKTSDLFLEELIQVLSQARTPIGYFLKAILPTWSLLSFIEPTSNEFLALDMSQLSRVRRHLQDA